MLLDSWKSVEGPTPTTCLGVFGVATKVPLRSEFASLEVALMARPGPVPVFWHTIVTVKGPTVNSVTVFPPGLAASSTIPFVPTRLLVVRKLLGG
jgi:hypothetical protein